MDHPLRVPVYAAPDRPWGCELRKNNFEEPRSDQVDNLKHNICRFPGNLGKCQCFREPLLVHYYSALMMVAGFYRTLLIP